VVTVPDTSLQSQPSTAIARALGQADLRVDDLYLVEINEAFAAVASLCRRGPRPGLPGSCLSIRC
jgi:acetyl-CoA C-acetyltransferase